MQAKMAEGASLFRHATAALGICVAIYKGYLLGSG
jgi:hypothetical protein